MRIFVIGFTIIIILCGSASSDVIHFKDGGEVEGIIKEQDGEYVVIDVGVGTMSVRQDEIDYVEEATPEELERLKKEKLLYEIDIGEYAPPGYEDISMIYTKTKDDRSALREARRESQALKAEIAQEEKKQSELLDMLGKKGEELKGIDAEKDVKRYNEVVAEMNTLNADLDKQNNKIKTLYEEEKKLNSKLTKLVDNYRTSYQLFRDTLSAKHEGIVEDEMLSDEVYFLDEMDVKMGEMERDFKRDVAQYTPEGDHIIVDTLINSSVLAQLMVDTGASIVLISNDVAFRLGIEYEDIHTEIDIIMADGSSVVAKPVILESVKVGDAKVRNVQAAILEKEAIGGVDGLLGMSFLSHFVIKVDSATNKLILERVL